MSVKQIVLSGLIVALTSLGTVRAQGPASLPSTEDVVPLYSPNGSGSGAASPFGPTGAPLASSPAAAPAGTTPEGVAIEEGSPPPPPPVLPPLGLPASPWLNYPRSPCCCGPVGGCCSGPIGYEIFFRSGMAFPIGGNLLDRILHTGWDVEGGGRLLFFNPQLANKAWTVSLSVSNIFARTGDENQPIDLFRVPVRTTIEVPGQTNQPGSIRATTPVIAQVPHVVASVSSLNMTFVNAGFGRDWWLCGSADPAQMHALNWRVGVEGGGRWGTAMVQFNEIEHHTDVVGGPFIAVHSYLDYPVRCGILYGGVRYEYNYIWSSILQDQNNSNYQSMNLLFQLGMRF